MSNKNEFVLRKPLKEDGSSVWNLIKNTKNLDLNSSYCYIMLCEFFKDTCVVAEKKNQPTGFISAYIQPDDIETLFVWQVVVDENHRGKGLAKLMINELLNRDAVSDVRFIKTTVTPNNNASSSFFKSLAKELNTDCVTDSFFPEDLFPEGGHEEELLYTIGPFR